MNISRTIRLGACALAGSGALILISTPAALAADQMAVSQVPAKTASKAVETSARSKAPLVRLPMQASSGAASSADGKTAILKSCPPGMVRAEDGVTCKHSTQPLSAPRPNAPQNPLPDPGQKTKSQG